MPNVVRVMVETTPKRTFASALDWPGLARAGRDEAAAIEALRAVAPRYAQVASSAGEAFDADEVALEVVERREGDATTAFGAPSIVAEADRRPVGEREAATLAAIVEAAWAAFDRVAAAAPEALHKGRRGGGRDRSRVVEHVTSADEAYAAVLGIPATDRRTPSDLRARVLQILREPSDGAPVAGRKWPARYAARRIAWHALDHAWEILDRSDPA